MKICIVTGGSGGHIFPALTYAEYIRDHRHTEVVFIGNDHKMEATLVPDAGFSFYGIHNQGLQGSKTDKVKAMFSQFKAVRLAKDYLKQLKPDAVVAFGGYVSAPVVYAAQALNIPIVLHEQNAFPGKANKMVARYAQAIITCYPEAFAGYPNVMYLGNPQASLVQMVTKSATILEDLDLSTDLPIVLLVMGSQGSTAMNEKFLEYIAGFDAEDYQVVIVPGPSNYEDFMKRVDNHQPHLHIVPFVDQKALLPHLALMVARSGASTIAEIESFGIPSLLIPSPHVANNHQYYNAKSLFDDHACEMLLESECSGLVLQTRIEALIANHALREQLSANAKKRAKPNAVIDIADCVERVIERYEKATKVK